MTPNFHVANSPELKSKDFAIEIKADTFVKYLGRLHPVTVHFWCSPHRATFFKRSSVVQGGHA